jgi:hypothetical protein
VGPANCWCQPYPSRLTKTRQHTHQIQAVRHQNKYRMSLDDAHASNARRRGSMGCRQAASKHTRRGGQNHHGRDIRFESERGSCVRRRRPRLENRAGQNRPATAMARRAADEAARRRHAGSWRRRGLDSWAVSIVTPPASALSVRESGRESNPAQMPSLQEFVP